MSPDIERAAREVAEQARKTSGAGISIRRLREHLAEIDEVTIVFRNVGGEYQTVGVWIPARLLDERPTGQ